ncbi:hypothetical protein C8R43DRAFT_1129577 [Mycena crocata]|nr:hypothetical protein C8R43DRAFT_1129577 [Mycena crocata]
MSLELASAALGLLGKVVPYAIKPITGRSGSAQTNKGSKNMEAARAVLIDPTKGTGIISALEYEQFYREYKELKADRDISGLLTQTFRGSMKTENRRMAREFKHNARDFLKRVKIRLSKTKPSKFRKRRRWSSCPQAFKFRLSATALAGTERRIAGYGIGPAFRFFEGNSRINVSPFSEWRADVQFSF